MNYLETSFQQARTMPPWRRRKRRQKSLKIDPPPPKALIALRRELKVSRTVFAKVFLFKLNTYRNWELKRGSPARASAILLRLIMNDPRAMLGLVARVKRRYGTNLIPPTPQELVNLRTRLGLSQLRFTQMFRLGHGTYCEWEQDCLLPGHTATLLLRLVELEPQRMQRMIHLLD